MIKIRARFRACIWSCAKCGLTFKGENTKRPSGTGCTAGGLHNWKCTTI